jgi:hypothetical protein
MAYGTAPTSGGTGDAVTTDSLSTIDGGAASGEAQIVKVGFGDAGDATIVKATAGLPISVNGAYFTLSTANSTTAQLSPGQTFTGTIETALSQPCISFLMNADQDCLIELQQFSDIAGTKTVPDIEFKVFAGVGFSGSYVLNGSYVRVRVTNLGYSTTTTLFLDVAYGTLPPATALGNSPTSINEVGGKAITGSVPVTIQVPDNGLLVRDAEVTKSQTSEGATSVFISGDPGGDYAGINLFEEAFNQQLRLPVNTPDILKDGKGGLILSDGVQSFYSALTGTTNGLGVIDTTGYGSIVVSGYAGGGTVQVLFSDNGKDWNTVFGTRNYNGGSVDAASSVIFTAALPGALIYPVAGKFAQVRITAVTTAPAVVSVVLKQAAAPTAPFGYSPAGANLSVAVGSITAGTNAIGDVGIQYRASATGAATISKFTAAATTNAASIKASAGRVVGWSLVNTTAAIKVFRFFNKASAPTVGTDSPAFVVYLAANGRSDIAYDGGLSFATGIAIACTGAIGDLDATATAANDVLGAIFYA